VTVHDLAMLRFPGTKPDVHVRQFRGAVARSARRATRVIAVSKATGDDLRELWGLDETTVRIVPNGVDDWLTPGDRAAAAGAVRERWAITTPFVLHVGSIEPRKGLDVLIDAAALASARGAPWRLVLAGAAGFRADEITARARDSGACSVLGAVSDTELLSLYRAADAFAAPALSEGFGIAPLEAMACGTPVVVAGDSGGLEETSGPAAIVVSERTAAAWLAGLDQALARPDWLIEAGLRHAARFRWHEVTGRTRAVLSEAAGA
jgi:glycosyltransferase involved in cell wall biosynthesis